jgi:uncharacterized protein
MLKIASWASATFALAIMTAAPAAAARVTDCPLRDVPFSAQSPLIDVMLSPEAMAVLNKAVPGRFDKMPSNFLGTKPPTFGAILTLETASRFTGLDQQTIAAIDIDLRKLPVTEADKKARCERYDNDVPKFQLAKDKPNILVFGKINGFKDAPSFEAAEAALKAIAERKGWALSFTEKGGAFNAKTLGKFDAIVWNNISGDVLTLAQRKAFQRYMEQGGGFFGIHGSAGDPAYFWNWYADKLIGARFAGHPRNPQFQEARIVVDSGHKLATGLPVEWRMTDEWYSFKTNPRAAGAKVLLTLDEASYNPNDPAMPGLIMGADHPLAWTNCIGKGRMFYSAIGHRPETFSQPQHVTMLENALSWVISNKKACHTGN